MKWFRFYSDALDDPKVQRLPGDLFKAWVNILCLASRYSGTLPPMEDMKFALRLSEAKITTLLDELAAHGLIDDTGDGLQPHNWKKRQYKSDNVTARVQAHRDHCNVSVTPDETFHETPPKRFGNGATENREQKQKTNDKTTGNGTGRVARSDKDVWEPETPQRDPLQVEREEAIAEHPHWDDALNAATPSTVRSRLPYQAKIWRKWIADPSTAPPIPAPAAPPPKVVTAPADFLAAYQAETNTRVDANDRRLGIGKYSRHTTAVTGDALQ